MHYKLIYTTRAGKKERVALVESEEPAEAVLARFVAFQEELKAAGRLDYARGVRIEEAT